MAFTPEVTQFSFEFGSELDKSWGYATNVLSLKPTSE